MNEQTYCWETIFTGELEVGVNKEQLESLTDKLFCITLKHYHQQRQHFNC